MCVSGSMTMAIGTSTNACARPDTKSIPNRNPTTKQHAVVNIQLKIETRPTYPDKFIQDVLLHRLGDFRL